MFNVNTGLSHSELVLIERTETLNLVLRSTRVGVWELQVQTDVMKFDEQWCALLGYKVDVIDWLS